jgi:hypothetical protein
MRAGHFHSGLDIRTNGKTGYPVYAIADGYVSRIKVSAVGYGYAVYINHPGGHTSVYGHMERYNDTIGSFIKTRQYQLESFEVDELLKPGQLPVKKGDLIGYTGNSGSSGGPHLHFEIRDTKTEFPLHPMLFGFDLKDTIAPDFKTLYVYALQTGLAQEAVKLPFTKNKATDTWYVQDTLKLNADSISFGLITSDRMNDNTMANDIYHLDVKVNGAVVFAFTIDKFGFDNTRYVQAHQDYALDIAEEKKVHRCWKLPGNLLDIYTAINNGIIPLKEGKAANIAISVADITGNTSTLNLVAIKSSKSAAFKKETVSSDPVFHYDKKNVFSAAGIRIKMQSLSLYRDIRFTYSASLTTDPLIYSPIHHVHKDIEAVQKYYDLSLKPAALPPQLKDKAYIALRYRDGKTRGYESVWEDGMLTCKTRDFCDFYVAIDTLAPTVIVQGPKDADYTQRAALNVRIEDRYSGIKSYRGTIDGHWALFAYDAKNNLLTYTFDNMLAPGEHQLKLVVTDKVNNSATLDLTFKK